MSVKRTATLTDYDIVFVDECSTIDNRTMKRLLEKIDESTLLVLAGDIYQIESIDFGNWFYYAKDIIKTDGANVELLNTWRTDKKELKGLWDEVRKIQPIITEKLAIDGPFSADIGEEIFVSQDEDEIVLCLNYDGKFGLNNMNLYFQNANTKSEVYTWAEWTFKVGDPVIFLDTKRSPILYNNLKGRIVDISKRDSAILFTLDIDTILTERQCRNESFEFVDVTDRGTRIRLEVIASDDESAPEEERFKTIIPFQIAYAVSIHKAQGLEYNSVKIIIPSYNAEKISHSIFYTAITRAKEKLKIFWSAETMKAIVESFDKETIGRENACLGKQLLWEAFATYLGDVAKYKEAILFAEKDVKSILQSGSAKGISDELYEIAWNEKEKGQTRVQIYKKKYLQSLELSILFKEREYTIFLKEREHEYLV